MLIIFHILNDAILQHQDLLLPIAVVLCVVLLTRYLIFTPAAAMTRRSRPVSYPGGPRPKRGTYRAPQWQQKNVRPHHPIERGWHYVEAAASHRATEARFASVTKCATTRLTGESTGRQTWQFDPHDTSDLPDVFHFDPSTNPNSSDLLYRRQQLQRSSNTTSNGKPPSALHSALHASATKAQKEAKEAAYLATSFYSQLQCDDGHWGGDYGGPMFLMPGIVVVAYVTGIMDDLFPAPHRRAMIAYLRNHQQEDGGWGTHIESPSTMFGSTLSYVTLRLLGVPPHDQDLVRARLFMHGHGGALFTSSWAKFWLCVLGVYEWDGINSIPPEMWLLPNWFPFHPGKMWCHSRMVYLPMCYIYGQRWVYPGATDGEDPLIVELRQELYEISYDTIQWTKYRHSVADIDNYSPITWLMRTAHNVLAWYEWAGGCRCLRSRGLAFAIDYIRAEDIQTNFVDIGPVNKTMNMLSVFIDVKEDVNDPHFEMHMLRVEDYLWVAEDGMKMQGYNGSQCWDTSFAARAIAEANLAEAFPQTVKNMWSFLERTQILSTEVSRNTPAFEYEKESLRRKYFRHVSQGGWPFSTSAHGWPISDCTSEGLKAVLVLRKLPFIQKSIKSGRLLPISDQRLFDGCNVVLTMQNTDGGWATYENTRGGGWFELMNPSEVFGEIMIDYSYVECTSASLCCLIDFQQQFPEHRTLDIQHAISQGRSFVRDIQRPDGSWYGSWACCFTYGTWFGIEALVYGATDVDADGEEIGDQSVYKSLPVQKAVSFLLNKQNNNGGWGEDFTSCYDKQYALHGAKVYGTGGSSVPHTSWALLALMAAKCEDYEAIERGIYFLREMQRDNGDWPQEGISGVFNRACGITYTQYRNVFSLWSLGRFSSTKFNV